MVLLWPCAGRAGLYEGVTAYELGEYGRAFEELSPLAEDGIAEAQFALGVMYDNGQGVRQDYRAAVRWYRKAAEQGYARAQSNLGAMYASGQGVPRDDAEAVGWFRRAAEQGLAAAQGRLGAMYDAGRGVPEDGVRAYAWYELAAAQGDEQAANFRDGLRRELSTEQLAEAQALSRELGAQITSQPSQGPEPEPHASGETSSASLVRTVQRALRILGYDPGPVDGRVGPRTAAAIKAFQFDEGIVPSGEVSADLAVRLTEVLEQRRGAKRPQREPAAEPTHTGTGFLVDAHGRLLTAQHVVAGCKRLTVPIGGAAQPASVLAVDSGNDLALLEVAQSSPEFARFRASGPPRLGETVTVAGYPLRGLLSDELNVTSGTVSAMSGPGNDRRIVQITAPVQEGNSGAPLLDASGQVIGVVIAKLDAVKTAEITGDIPQNVNFAIKGSLARAFLDVQGVDSASGESDEPIGNPEVAALARHFTLPVECWK